MSGNVPAAPTLDPLRRMDGSEVREPLETVRSREADIAMDRKAYVNIALSSAARRYEERFGNNGATYDFGKMTDALGEQAKSLRDAADEIDGRLAGAKGGAP
ncbi:MAG: hypothetical protein ISS15_05475 [Alphaproteobacteria bacterium]|nr:hypothetical protein [Alphaproteobacteria bacterium]MBL6939429.1 hypothetical protein [Alphaproteobacteria bacterium]MBL7097090.1 hypothetical protein [Alphaproteobacteria bacterium]